MKKLSRILVFQHIAAEHPGIFRNYLHEDGIEWIPVEWDEGETIDDIDGFDALWVMGGPMDVWEEQQYPWLKLEKSIIRNAVLEQNIPYLGFCLGHQLLADALDGAVGMAEEPEIGILDIHSTADGVQNPFLNNLPGTIKCLQWHSAEVTRAPQNAKILASTPACNIQAMSIGQHALSVQFHIEITPTTVSEWGDIPAYKSALEKKLGKNAFEQINTEASANIDDMNRYSRILYDNWKHSVLAN